MLKKKNNNNQPAFFVMCAEFGGNCATCHKSTKRGGNDLTNVWTFFRYGASAKIKSLKLWKFFLNSRHLDRK